MAKIDCPRCERTFCTQYDEPRFHAGRFVETLPDGTVAEYDQVCTDCHRELVRD